MATSNNDSRRAMLELEREMLLFMIVDDLEMASRCVVKDWWSPPMTSSGRHVTLARELERRIRSFWTSFAPAPGKDRSLARNSLRRILTSDDAFRLFPVAAHDELRRIELLLGHVLEASLE